MKKCPFIFSLVVALMLVGCETEPQQSPATANGQTEQKSQFVASMEDRLHDFDAKLARLKQKSVDLKGDAKVQADKALEQLSEQRDKAATKLEELKRKSASTWDEVKTGMISAMDKLRSEYESLKASFE